MFDLGWPELPRFVARLLSVRAQLAHHGELAELSSQSEYCAVRDALLLTVDVIQPDACKDPPVLQSYLTRVWKTVSENHVDALSAPSMKGLNATLQQQYHGDYCVQCQPPEICNGDASPGAIRTHGHCLSSLTNLFTGASAFADALYLEHAGIEQGFRPDFAFSTGHMSEIVKQLNVAVTGRAGELPTTRDRRRRRSIRITVAISKFELEDYIACLYVIFHECFVHGWCGVALGGDQVCLSDSFHEGWMDLVGLRLLCDCLSSTNSPLASLVTPHETLFQEISKRVSEVRSDYQRRGAPRSAAINGTGVKAAKTLRGVFGLVFDNNVLADSLFYKFSLRLNASDYSDEARGRVVTSVNCRFGGPKRGQLILEQPHIYDAIRDFQRDMDAKKLAAFL